MAYQFKKHKMIDGKRYGPTGNGWYYQPADYHGIENYWGFGCGEVDFLGNKSNVNALHSAKLNLS